MVISIMRSSCETIPDGSYGEMIIITSSRAQSAEQPIRCDRKIDLTLVFDYSRLDVCRE